MTVAKQLATVSVVGAVFVGVVSASAVARPASQRASLTVVRASSTPDGKGVLSSRRLNTVVASTNLAFVVKIRNGAARRSVKITVVVSRPDSNLGAIVKTKAFELRGNYVGTVKVGPFAPVMFARRASLTVEVADSRTGKGEATAYPVIFSLG
jgi:hypothetical protein